MAPEVAAGRNLIVAAHGNSLRALVKHIFALSDAAILEVEIPTGNPLLVTLDPVSLKPTAARYLDELRANPVPPVPGA
jgi:2,3-bisphosphoglycerate-dependent phosphoglycerate mutase